MKVAVCLSGQTRSLEKTWQSIQEFLVEPYQSDIFVHTWHDSPGVSNTSLRCLDNVDNFFGDKIVSSLYESHKDVSPYLKSASKENQSSMFYSILACNELKKSFETKNSFKYDLVIRSRMDCLFHQEIEKSSIDKLLCDENLILVRGESDHRIFNGNFFFDQKKSYICDIFAIGSSKSMDIFCDVYNHDELLKSDFYDDSESKIPELLKPNNVRPDWLSFKFFRQKSVKDDKFVMWSDYKDEGYIEKLV
jgi:hypothetical protein